MRPVMMEIDLITKDAPLIARVSLLDGTAQ